VNPEPRPPRTDAPALLHRRCPRCGGSLSRVQRNAFDRVVSLLAPRARYRCRAFDCGWTGTLSR
jgi:uncharacterized protein with PIN domain